MSPARRAVRLIALLLAVGCGAPHGPVATGRRAAGPAGPAAPSAVTQPRSNAAPLRHRVRADVVVVAPTPLAATTVTALRRVAPNGLATYRSARVRLGIHNLELAGIDPGRFRAFAPSGTANADAVWNAVARGELVVAHDVAKARRLELGATTTIGRTPLRVAAYATTGLPDVGAMVSGVIADALHLPADNAAVLTAGKGDPAALAAAVRRVVGSRATIHLLTQPRTPYAYLTGTKAAKAFGAFSYRWYDDGTIEPDARWVAANIVTADVPILGRVTCHRLMVRQLRGALAAVRAAGLSGAIHTYDGCYVPRFIERDPAHAISLHTWGIAIDLDARTNQRGGRGTMDPRVVAIFTQWGFRWGGDWSYTDPMHFELGALLAP